MRETGNLFVLKSRDGVPVGADYSVKAFGAMAEPHIREGDTVYATATADLKNGDVGIFLYSGKMVVRQYCEDSFGNIYLFTLDRKMKENDITIPANAQKTTVCFGKVIMKENVHLPEN